MINEKKLKKMLSEYADYLTDQEQERRRGLSRWKKGK